MHPLQVAARFAAYTWYQGTHPGQPADAAVRFAGTHWPGFLEATHEGLGRLLLQIAQPQADRTKRPRRRVAVAS